MTSLLQNSIQTTAYSIINLHDLELNDQTTQASYQDSRNQMATSFDNLFVQTTSDSLQVCMDSVRRNPFTFKIIGSNDVMQ